MAQHTPGEWHAQGYHVWATGPGEDHCIVERADGWTPEEARENARLIAAAPDLLAALEAVMRVADRKTVEFDAARAALAKAKGGAP